MLGSVIDVFPAGLLTVQQCPNERQQSRVLTDVLQPINTDTDVVQTHQHQPAARHKQSAQLCVFCRSTVLTPAAVTDIQHTELNL